MSLSADLVRRVAALTGPVGAARMAAACRAWAAALHAQRSVVVIDRRRPFAWPVPHADPAPETVIVHTVHHEAGEPRSGDTRERQHAGPMVYAALETLLYNERCCEAGARYRPATLVVRAPGVVLVDPVVDALGDHLADPRQRVAYLRLDFPMLGTASRPALRDFVDACAASATLCHLVVRTDIVSDPATVWCEQASSHPVHQKPEIQSKKNSTGLAP